MREVSSPSYECMVSFPRSPTFRATQFHASLPNRKFLSKLLQQVIQFVTFSSHSWRSLNSLKGSQNLHPKKVTAWITRQTTFHYENIRLGFQTRNVIELTEDRSTPLISASESRRCRANPKKCPDDTGNGFRTDRDRDKSGYMKNHVFTVWIFLILYNIHTDRFRCMDEERIHSCRFHTTPDPKPHPPHGEWDLQSSSFSACFLAFQVPQIAEEILLHDSRSCSCKLLIKY